LLIFSIFGLSQECCHLNLGDLWGNEPEYYSKTIRLQDAPERVHFECTLKVRAAVSPEDKLTVTVTNQAHHYISHSFSGRKIGDIPLGEFLPNDSVTISLALHRGPYSEFTLADIIPKIGFYCNTFCSQSTPSPTTLPRSTTTTPTSTTTPPATPQASTIPTLPHCTNPACCYSLQNPNPSTGQGYYEYDPNCAQGGPHCVGFTSCRLCSDPNAPNLPPESRPPCSRFTSSPRTTSSVPRPPPH
jgi:hypothetical protein